MPVEDQPVEPAATCISFSCSACGKTLKAKAELAGRKVKCSQCAQPMLVPETKVSDTAVPDKRKWWLLPVVGTAVVVSAAVVCVLLTWLWLSRGGDTHSPGNPNSDTDSTAPYDSKLQAEIDKVKAGKTTIIDARDLVKAEVVITDRDLVALQELTTVKILNLDGTSITNKGLKSVARVTSLFDLSLTATGVDDAGLAALATLTNLEILRLDRLAITEAGLAHLKALPKLRRLSLYKTPTNDAGLAHLQSLSCLEWISLDETEVTNDGLRHLSGLKKLKRIQVWNTKVNDAGIQEFHRVRPDVLVK